MRSRWLALIVLLAMGILAACGTANNASNLGSDVQAPSSASQDVRLQDNYTDALSIQGQLAAGTLLLEGTDLTVDEALAADLLPLWRAAQSLMSSDTAATLEIEAIYNQIQDTMTPDQIAAIAEMKLTEDSLETMLEEGELFSGQGGFAAGRGERFIPPEGFVMRGGESGQGPGGGFGQGPGGGFPEGMDPEVMATRQAQFAGNNQGSLQDRALIMMVIRTLQTKTGELSEDRPGRLFDVAYDVVAEATGLSQEEIRAQVAEGLTLAEIVEANGGDVEAVRKSLVEALGELPNAAEMDLEQLASQWLGLDQ
jgi:predicted small secreted protein